ncbi:MAG TPA: nucleoside-diphosphate sugar epimerase/dehydratase [Alphaproteobacteria bacterium]|nr:nucleoside-diphosphate sugar epimerase/dehydratase [Alphaproteobacteria bacterium]
MQILSRILTRARVVYLHDLVMVALSFLVSLYLRVGSALWWYLDNYLWPAFILFVLVAAVTLLALRTNRTVWRYVSMEDLVGIAKVSTIIVLAFFPLLFLWTRLEQMPRSMLVINWFVLTALLGGPRVLYRILKHRHLGLTLAKSGHRRVPVLLVGAGDGADLFIRAMQHEPTAHYQVVGLIDEKGSRVGRDIHGVPVLGSTGDLAEIVAKCARRNRRPERLIVTKENLEPEILRGLLEGAEALGLTLARAPRMTDLRDGVSDRFETRPIAIEDILGRPQTVLDRAGMRAMIAGRRVLVTGAGGTIGGELVRQIAELEPRHLALLDNGEFNLYRIDQDLTEQRPELPHSAILADVRDAKRVSEVFAVEKPEIVFHAAALKHVPMVERNPSEGVLTNLIGTRQVADACDASGVAAMVLISTDKAVNPASVMGATKRAAECYCQARDILAAAGRRRTRYITVRFGNVLGSTGSVVPLFQHQIERGGPITVTHPDIARYFMTVREAVELVLQAAALGATDGVEAGKIFVLDMGKAIRIVDLARQMIRLAGLRPEKDIRIVFTGLRPGEKLNEELLHETEYLVPTRCRGILLAAPRTADLAILSRALDEIGEAAAAAREEQLAALLERVVPEYRRVGEGVERVAAASR